MEVARSHNRPLHPMDRTVRYGMSVTGVEKTLMDLGEKSTRSEVALLAEAGWHPLELTSRSSPAFVARTVTAL